MDVTISTFNEAFTLYLFDDDFPELPSLNVNCDDKCLLLSTVTLLKE